MTATGAVRRHKGEDNQMVYCETCKSDVPAVHVAPWSCLKTLRDERDGLRVALLAQQAQTQAAEAQVAELRQALDDASRAALHDAQTICYQRVEIERLRTDYNAEVDEFNAGYDACKAGELVENEPGDMPHDMWRPGYAWAAFDDLRAEVKRLRGGSTQYVVNLPEHVIHEG